MFSTPILKAETKAEISEVLLWDVAGRLVKKVRFQEGTGISLDGLRSGMLLVEVRLVDGTSRTGRSSCSLRKNDPFRFPNSGDGFDCSDVKYLPINSFYWLQLK